MAGLEGRHHNALSRREARSDCLRHTHLLLPPMARDTALRLSTSLPLLRRRTFVTSVHLSLVSRLCHVDDSR